MSCICVPRESEIFVFWEPIVLVAGLMAACEEKRSLKGTGGFDNAREPRFNILRFAETLPKP
jgi:hypothetical protein